MTTRDEKLEAMLKKSAEGCCMDDKWRGRTCSYHEGFADGIDMAYPTDDPGTP